MLCIFMDIKRVIIYNALNRSRENSKNEEKKCITKIIETIFSEVLFNVF